MQGMARVASMAPRTRYFILASPALGFADGVAAYSLYPGQPFALSSLVIGIAALFLIFLWYRLDSDSRHFKRPALLSVGVVGLSSLAIPYYLFRTRGIRDGSVATLVFLLIGVGYSAMGYVGQLVARALQT
jgi:hypothetical protein